MYCPNCASPIDGTKFCRSCGANVSLVPQALTGNMPQEPREDDPSDDLYYRGRRSRRRGHHRDRKEEPSIERAASRLFSGVGFLIAAIFVCLYFPGGYTWGWSFLFPAFGLIGDGVGQYLKLQEQRRQISMLYPRMNHPVFHPSSQQVPTQVPPQASPQAPPLSAPTTSELAKPASVTEHTTRHLESSNPRE
jgi:hypothetical protein